MITIKQEVKDLLRANVTAKSRLAYLFGKHSATIDRWIDNNHPILTSQSAVNAISEELNISVSKILTGK